MKFEMMEKHYWTESHDKNTYGGIYIFCFESEPFKFNWFTDYGEWFVYITFGETWFRFSGAGFMSSNKTCDRIGRAIESKIDNLIIKINRWLKRGKND